MSTTAKSTKTKLVPGPCQNVPEGLEWLASIAERDAERIREEIVQEAIERHKQKRKPKSPK